MAVVLPLSTPHEKAVSALLNKLLGAEHGEPWCLIGSLEPSSVKCNTSPRGGERLMSVRTRYLRLEHLNPFSHHFYTYGLPLP